MCYPDILATVKRKLEQLALLEKRECSWSAYYTPIWCRPDYKPEAASVVGNAKNI
jgi:hypothetical protein